MRIRVDHCKCPTYMGNLLASVLINKRLHLNIHDKASSKSLMTFSVFTVRLNILAYFLLTVHLYFHISIHFNKMDPIVSTEKN
jgi:hypothetical protein